LLVILAKNLQKLGLVEYAMVAPKPIWSYKG